MIPFAATDTDDAEAIVPRTNLGTAIGRLFNFLRINPIDACSGPRC